MHATCLTHLILLNMFLNILTIINKSLLCRLHGTPEPFCTQLKVPIFTSWNQTGAF
jgi:hypothetical protein